MTKKKLENTKKINFQYKDNLIEALKDNNISGKKYNEKSAYDLIKSLEIHYPNISLNYDVQTKQKISEYIKQKNKKTLDSLEDISTLSNLINN